MPDILLTIKTEGTWGLKHETSPRTYDVIKDSKGNTYSRLRYKNYLDKNTALKKDLDIKVIDNFLSQLSQINIPAFPYHENGCDGGYTELKIGGYNGKSHYRWWSGAPKGWEKLDKITYKILEYIYM